MVNTVMRLSFFGGDSQTVATTVSCENKTLQKEQRMEAKTGRAKRRAILSEQTNDSHQFAEFWQNPKTAESHMICSAEWDDVSVWCSWLSKLAFQKNCYRHAIRTIVTVHQAVYRISRNKSESPAVDKPEYEIHSAPVAPWMIPRANWGTLIKKLEKRLYRTPGKGMQKKLLKKVFQKLTPAAPVAKPKHLTTLFVKDALSVNQCIVGKWQQLVKTKVLANDFSESVLATDCGQHQTQLAAGPAIMTIECLASSSVRLHNLNETFTFHAKMEAAFEAELRQLWKRRKVESMPSGALGSDGWLLRNDANLASCVIGLSVELRIELKLVLQSRPRGARRSGALVSAQLRLSPLES